MFIPPAVDDVSGRLLITAKKIALLLLYIDFLKPLYSKQKGFLNSFWDFSQKMVFAFPCV